MHKYKMFITYIPKEEGETPDFKIVRVIDKYMRTYPDSSNIISSPGYLSLIPGVKDFANEFAKSVPAGKKLYIGYGYGMNGSRIMSGKTLIHEQYAELAMTKKFIPLNMNIRNKKDHRKMMFFFKENTVSSFDFAVDILDKSTLNQFLDSITVYAVLVGSTNQSYTSYYGGRKHKADKGEADVLLFAAEDVKLLRQNMYVEGTIVFERRIGDTDRDPLEYFKGMLKEFLSNILA